MKKIILILVLVLAATNVSAEFSKVGSAGAQFLKIGVGAKYQAMGEASVAVANDVYATYWNPAGLAQIEGSEVSFTNVNWFLDIDLNYVAFAKYFEGVGTFGLSASILSMDDQEITTHAAQQGTGEYYTASSYAFGLSYARQLTNRFSFGATARYVGERIHNSKSSGIGVDFGTILHTGFRNLRIGMSITNMGTELEFSGPDLVNGNAEYTNTPYDMPMTFRVGAAYDVEMGPKSMLTFAGEIKHPNDNIQQGSLGAEYGFSEQFFLRTGYKFNYEEEGLSFGAGLNTRLASETFLVLDYAWQDFGRLSSTQRFSVGFTF